MNETIYKKDCFIRVQYRKQKLGVSIRKGFNTGAMNGRKGMPQGHWFHTTLLCRGQAAALDTTSATTADITAVSQPWTWWQDTGRLSPATTNTYLSDLLASIQSSKKMAFVLPLSSTFHMDASDSWSLICNKSFSCRGVWEM